MKKALLSMLACLLFASALAADTTYQPFVLASVNDAGLEEQTARTRAALETAGFQVAGQYTPLPKANVLGEPGKGFVYIGLQLSHLTLSGDEYMIYPRLPRCCTGSAVAGVCEMMPAR